MTGAQFRSIRQRMKLSQRELSARIELDHDYIGLIERGKRPLRRAYALAIRFLAQSQRQRKERYAYQKAVRNEIALAKLESSGLDVAQIGIAIDDNDGWRSR